MKTQFYDFGRENRFYYFGGKTQFCDFGREMILSLLRKHDLSLTKKLNFTIMVEKLIFTIFSGKLDLKFFLMEILILLVS